MAKKKFCAVVIFARYDDRDVPHLAHSKPHCFRKARQARAFVNAVNRDGGDPFDGGSEAKLCRKSCPRPSKARLSPREKRRIAAAQKRARDEIPF